MKVAGSSARAGCVSTITAARTACHKVFMKFAISRSVASLTRSFAESKLGIEVRRPAKE
jgi:hypothetical protein